MLKTLITCFLLLGFSMAVLAQSSEELKKKQADIQHEIDALRQTLNDTKKNKKVGLVQLAAVQKKLRLREQAINNISDQINVIQGTINKSRTEITVYTQELDTLKAQYEKSIVYAYKNRGNYDYLNFIFSANNFNDALKRIEYLKSYRQYREQQATAIKSTQALLQQKITDLTASRKDKDDALQKQQ
jgi:peptidoglycan hydrolase CwlO-like protein